MLYIFFLDIFGFCDKNILLWQFSFNSHFFVYVLGEIISCHKIVWDFIHIYFFQSLCNINVNSFLIRRLIQYWECLWLIFHFLLVYVHKQAYMNKELDPHFFFFFCGSIHVYFVVILLHNAFLVVAFDWYVIYMFSRCFWFPWEKYIALVVYF